MSRFDCPNGTECLNHSCIRVGMAGEPCGLTFTGERRGPDCGPRLHCTERCEPLPRPGEDCAALGVPCARGARCGGQKCVAFVPRVPGESCDPANLRCVESLCADGRCVQPAEDGQPCSDAMLCRKFSFCVEGRCDGFEAVNECKRAP